MALALVTGAWSGTQTTQLIGTTQGRPAAAGIVYVKDEPGEAIFQKVGGALDLPMRYRVSSQSVADVFSGSGAKARDGQRTDGLSVLTQVTEVWKVYDDADNSVTPYYLPVSAHMVWKVPIDALVTAAEVNKLIARLIGGVSRAATDSYATAAATLLTGATRLPDPAA